jgi:hypothetical protein
VSANADLASFIQKLSVSWHCIQHQPWDPPPQRPYGYWSRYWTRHQCDIGSCP